MYRINVSNHTAHSCLYHVLLVLPVQDYFFAILEPEYSLQPACPLYRSNRHLTVKDRILFLQILYPTRPLIEIVRGILGVGRQSRYFHSTIALGVEPIRAWRYWVKVV